MQYCSSYKTRSQSCKLYDNMQSIRTCIATGAVWSYPFDVLFLVVQYWFKCIFVYWYVLQFSRHTIFSIAEFIGAKTCVMQCYSGISFEFFSVFWCNMKYKHLTGDENRNCWAYISGQVSIAYWIDSWRCPLYSLYLYRLLILYIYPPALSYT